MPTSTDLTTEGLGHALDGRDLADDSSPVSSRETTTPWWRDVPSLAVLVTLLLVGLPFTHAAGGRDPYVLSWALLLLVPAAVAVRPWRAWRALDLLALTPALAALLACFVAPTGFEGNRDLASLAYAGLLFLLVRGYLALGGRTVIVVGALLVAGFDQILRGWWAWYGSQDASHLINGTFYWHNQFAVFVAAIGLLAGVLVVRGTGRVRVAAAVLVVLCVPALLFAASLATLGIAVFAWLVLAAVSLRDLRTAVLMTGLPVAGVALTAVLGSSLFMGIPGTPWSSVQTRTEANAASSSSSRAAYVDASFTMIERHPLTGTGFGSFGGASQPLMATDVIPTEYVHNGFVQAFVDGGVGLGSAMIAVTLVPAYVGARRLLRERLGRRGDRADAVTLAAYAGFGVLVAHSAYDFDWSYPALLALFAVLAALITRGTPRADTDDVSTRARARGTVMVGAALVLLVALPVSVRAGVLVASGLDAPAWTRIASYGVSMKDVPAWAEGVGACRTRILTDLADAGPEPGLDRDIDCIERAAADQPRLQMIRATAMVHAGRVAEGEALARSVVAEHADHVPSLLVAGALVPRAAGDDAAAESALEAVVRDPRVATNVEALNYAERALSARRALRGAPDEEAPGA